MPIRKSSTAAGRRVGRQSALKLFTDRDHERELLRNFFERLAHPRSRAEKPILSIWGAGGIGKTSVLKKAVEELGRDLASLRLISLDLDHDRWKPSTPVAEFFWQIRSQLWAAKPRGTPGGHGIETSLFDYLYFALWRAQHPGERFDLSDSVLKDLLNTSTQGSNIIAEASANLSTASSAVSGLVFLLDKGLASLRNRARKGLLRKRGLNPEAMTVKEMETELGPMLAADLEQWLEEHPHDALCITLDGFERVQSTVQAEDIQKYFADWCGMLTDPDTKFAGRLGCVFLGRNRNRWDELYDIEWQTRIREHCVGGLRKEDARKFIESAATYHRNHEDPVTANNLRNHVDAILAATCEQRGREEPSSFHPYYMDLAYGTVHDQGIHFQPADLGKTPTDLEIRFLRYLQIGHRDVFEAFRCLALAGSFDEALFNHLVRQGCIAAGLHFAVIAGEDYSYVEEIRDMPGTFRFHRLMELALIKNQSAKAEDRAVARQRIDVILAYFKKGAAFSKLADCSSRHLSAYEKGMTIAFDRYNDGLIDLISLDAFFSALEEPFDFKAYVNLRCGWWSKMCELRQRHLGLEHPAVASSLNNLALLYHSQGQYVAAESLYKQAMAIRERATGPEHPDVATNINNLAVLYHNRGQYAQAESLYQRALAIREKALGPEHPAVADSLNNVALLYCNQGQYAQAGPFYQRALAIREKALGLEHPDVANSLNNLAGLYDNQGDYAQAEPLYQQALAIREKAFGPEHPDVATNVNNLALLYHNQGRYAQAEPLYQRALAIREKVLGPEHPDMANTLNNLAGLYHNQGRYEQAEPLYQRALAIREKALGQEHPDVANSLNNLALLFHNQGRYAQAEPLYQRALTIQENALGQEHPAVANSLNNLALLYCSQDQYTQAWPLYKRALAVREKALGLEHPAVANSLNNLAGLYENQGQYEQAEPLYRQALAIREKAFGPEHPDVANSLNNLALLYHNQGQYAQAEPLYQRALAIREKTVGQEHPAVATYLENYVLCLRAMDRPDEAAALASRAEVIRAKHA
jgi:tetratricopeptide (TPR) repeat protein